MWISMKILFDYSGGCSSVILALIHSDSCILVIITLSVIYSFGHSIYLTIVSGPFFRHSEIIQQYQIYLSNLGALARIWVEYISRDQRIGRPPSYNHGDTKARNWNNTRDRMTWKTTKYEWRHSFKSLTDWNCTPLPDICRIFGTYSAGYSLKVSVA